MINAMGEKERTRGNFYLSKSPKAYSDMAIDDTESKDVPHFMFVSSSVVLPSDGGQRARCKRRPYYHYRPITVLSLVVALSFMSVWKFTDNVPIRQMSTPRLRTGQSHVPSNNTLHLANDTMLRNDSDHLLILGEDGMNKLSDTKLLKRVEGTSSPSGTTITSHDTTFNRQVPATTQLLEANSTAQKKRSRSWCVITNDSMWPGVNTWGWQKSVAHVAEALLPCWSWFVRTNATENCGFYVMDNLQQPHSWGKQLMESMGCKVKASSFPPEYNITAIDVLAKDDDVEVWQQLPFSSSYWFENRDDVSLLKKLVLSDADETTNIDDMSSPLQIGIVNRTTTRQIRNLSRFRDGIQVALKERVSVSISIQSLDDFSLQQQATWFAAKHIIIAAHGAGLTNCIFIRPNTTAISLYPRDYYFHGYFESMIEKVGGINMDWYEGDKRKARDVHKEMTITERETAKKIESFDVNVHDIASMVVKASERYAAVIE